MGIVLAADCRSLTRACASSVRVVSMNRSTALSALAVPMVAVSCGGGKAAPERHLVYVRATDPSNATVWIADRNGRRAHPLTRGYEAVVSPDGRTIAVGRRDGIHLITSDGKHDRRLTSSNRRPEAWSDDGRWLIAATDDSLAVAGADSGRTRIVGRGIVYGFSFSPDGRKLVYARAPRKGGEDICSAQIDLYVTGLAGGAGSRLTHDGRSAFPVWGRRRIAFMRRPKVHQFSDCFAPGIWTMRDDGTDVRAVVARAPRNLSRAGFYGLQPVAWLGSEALLVGVRSEWGNEPATLRVATGTLRRLAPVCARHAGHRACSAYYVDKVSRDRRFALGSGGNEKITISIIRLSDGRPTFTLRGYVCCPDWNQ